MTDLVFIQSHAPHGSIKGQEVLDACLMGSAFAQCTLVFLADGVYQLLPQETAALGVKDYSVSYGALNDYGVERICCLASDIEQRQLDPERFTVPVEVIDEAALQELMAEARQVLTF